MAVDERRSISEGKQERTAEQRGGKGTGAPLLQSPSTKDEFLHLVRKSGLVDEKHLENYLKEPRPDEEALPSEPPKLAQVLVRDGLLTHFQAERLLQGKWRGFTLGEYKLLERLGEGGMSSVYLGEHKESHHWAALKVLSTSWAINHRLLNRFNREARAAGTLDHPNILRIQGIEKDRGIHFLVTEYVKGVTLRDFVTQAGPLPLGQACDYMSQAALGLQHLYERGMVHRDVKPSNLMVTADGNLVKILDLGLVCLKHIQLSQTTVTQLTEEGMVVGTVSYMAPEQAAGEAVDIRSDLFSLGCTFWFLLAGQAPFNESNPAIHHQKQMNQEQVPIEQVLPDLPAGVAKIMAKLLAPNPRDRFQTPAELGEALGRLKQTLKPSRLNRFSQDHRFFPKVPPLCPVLEATEPFHGEKKIAIDGEKTLRIP